MDQYSERLQIQNALCWQAIEQSRQMIEFSQSWLSAYHYQHDQKHDNDKVQRVVQARHHEADGKYR
jgi:hypothetical protein